WRASTMKRSAISSTCRYKSKGSNPVPMVPRSGHLHLQLRAHSQPQPAPPRVSRKLLPNFPHSQKKWNASSSARKKIWSIEPAHHKPKRQSPFAPAQKLAATIHAPAARAKNTKNATAPTHEVAIPNYRHFDRSVPIFSPVRTCEPLARAVEKP